MPRNKRSLTSSKVLFLEYYQSLLPQFKTTESLELYLATNNHPVLLYSLTYQSELQRLWHHQNLTWQVLPWFPTALCWPQEASYQETLPGFQQGWLYSLHPSSLLPVLALNPQASETILDACAAPGGKTLAIANLTQISSPLSKGRQAKGRRGSDPSQDVSCQLVANDPALPRYKRLVTVLKHFGYAQIPTSHWPAQALQHRLHTKFDKILLDAPCSSEKHVFNSKHHLKIWNPRRSKRLAKQQVQLIKSLLPLLKPGGKLVYSTCALNPLENESVVAKVLQKWGDQLTLAPLPVLPVRGPGLADQGLTSQQCQQVLRLNQPYHDPMFVAVFKSPTKTPSED